MKVGMTIPVFIACTSQHARKYGNFILHATYMTTALLTSEEPEKLMVQHQGPQFLPCFLPNHHRTWHKIQSYL